MRAGRVRAGAASRPRARQGGAEAEAPQADVHRHADQHQERQPRGRSPASRAARSTCPKGTVLLSAKKTVTASDMQPVIGELDMITDGEKEGGDGYFIELGPGQAVGPDRPRRVARAPRDPRVALPQPGARLPRRRRPGVRRQGLHEGRDDGLQQRPRQLVEAGRRQGQGVHRGRRGPAVRPEGREGPLRAALLQREHDERPEPLRRSRGLRHAGE